MTEKEEPAAPGRQTIVGKLSALVREKWPEYVIEIVVIIFSITISFAFDEWKDDRHKREQEQAYLRGLYSDIQTDTSQLREIIAETRLVIQTASTLAGSASQPVGQAYPQFVSAIRLVFKRPRFIAEDATFSDLKSTGNMQVISSFELKSNLFEYYKKYESIVQIESAELETTNTIIGPYVLRRLPLAPNAIPTGTINWTAIRQEPEFQNAMLVRRSTREELLGNYQESLRLGQRILTQINAQLK